jgi:hypothetical protein
MPIFMQVPGDGSTKQIHYHWAQPMAPRSTLDLPRTFYWGTDISPTDRQESPQLHAKSVSLYVSEEVVLRSSQSSRSSNVSESCVL